MAILTKKLGTAHIDLAETAVQDALVKAVQHWPLHGIPDNPPAWILTVARNRALDLLKAARFGGDGDELDDLADETGDARDGSSFAREVGDEQLRLMLVCCHPAIPHPARIALTLKTVCGFGVGEIARAFLAKEETIAQRLVRAKQRIKDEKLPFAIPPPDELPERLDAVLDTVYLLFNEGFSAYEGDLPVRADICREACRLARALADHPVLGAPKSHALAALLLLQASRLDARMNAEGDIQLLEEQDRGDWDHTLIAEGVHYLQSAGQGRELSTYHLLAGIAACHATAPSFEATDWACVLDYYDVLTRLAPSPVVALNRAVAVAFLRGADAGVKELKKLRAEPALASYHLFHATYADLLRRAGRSTEAVAHYERALALVRTTPERRFLVRRLQACQDSGPGL